MDINRANNKDLTALLYAATYALPSTVFQLMIDHGANVNYVNRYNCNVLYLYCQFNKNLDLNVVKALLRAGFEPTLLPEEEFYRLI